MEEAYNRPGQTPESQSDNGILKIYTLGRFQVCLGDQYLFNSVGRSQKLGELLMYLITNRGKHINPETIFETMWPEHDYNDPRNALKNLVYRLKKTFEQMQIPDARSYISYSYGGYGWNTGARYWLDVDVFEALCQDARSLIRLDPFQAAGKYREALSLYHGHYLPECQHCHWVLPKHHFYRRLFIRSVSDLLSFQREQRLFSEMVDDAEWALAIEEFDESIHLSYMEALLEEGKTAQARVHYEYITALNYCESGSKPLPAMQRIYRRIKDQSKKAVFDYKDMRQMLVEKDTGTGALFCDPEIFRLYCRLERRRAERDTRAIQLGLLTLAGPGKNAVPADMIKKAMESLRKVLSVRLRKADIVTPWNDNQFTVLLPGITTEQAENLLERIREDFKAISHVDGLTLRSTVHSFLPSEITAFK